jgi:hypothetical protein
MAMVQWIMTTSTAYLALATKDNNALYFLQDTKEIYKGATPYTEAVSFYTTTLPTKGAQGKIYIESTTLKGDVWDGAAWKTVIQPVSQTVLEGETPTTKPVSGAAVAAYVTAQSSAISAQAVTNMVWDETNKAIKYTKNGTDTSVPLTKLGVTVAYDGATGVLTLKDSAGTSLSTVNLPLDNFVKSGTYNDTTKAMVLTLQDSSTVTIPAADLVKLYHEGDTNTANITISNVDGNNVITVDVKVSATANNAIVANADGLFVDKEALLHIADGATAENHIVSVGADGHAKDSGVLVTDLTTKTYVDGIRDALDAAKVNKTDIVISKAALNTETPSETKVVSEKALIESLSWQTL